VSDGLARLDGLQVWLRLWVVGDDIVGLGDPGGIAGPWVKRE
jgi:hypothetical protein